MERFDYVIRRPTPSDLNFIQATFIKSMKRESPIGRSTSASVFFSEFPHIVDHILATSHVAVAAHLEEPDVVFGYLIHDDKGIHYAFTKAAFRRLGIARGLVSFAFPEAKTIMHSQATKASKAISEKHPELIFNPFICYRKGAV